MISIFIIMTDKKYNRSKVACDQQSDVWLPTGKFIHSSGKQNIPPSNFSNQNMGGLLDTCKDNCRTNGRGSNEKYENFEDDFELTGHGRDIKTNQIGKKDGPEIDDSENENHFKEKLNVNSNNGCGKNLQDQKGDCSKIVPNVGSNFSRDNGDFEDIIDTVWQKIDATLPKYKEKYENRKKLRNSCQSWKVIRLFISSTFTDFHAEREVLVKKVIPELKEWCEQYQIHLLECDLRWGVPKNTKTEETINICMGELDKCIDETDAKPFFLNMLGERYGWIPTLKDLSDELISNYEWVYPTSITHMEILHAALRTNSENSLFMMRDKDSLANIPQSFARYFLDEIPLAKKCLQRLKNEITERFPDQTFGYKSTASGIDNSTGMEKVSFIDLDEFETSVIEFFKRRITCYASENNMSEQMSETSRQQLMQDVFIAKRGQWVIGREEEINAMMNFVQNDENEGCLLIVAEPGMGKSSLVAKQVLKLNEANRPCLYNFSSSAPGSTNSLTVLQRFCQELSEKLETEPPLTEERDNYDYLKAYFHEKLVASSERIKGLTIVLDAVNQFYDMFGRSCDWLPTPHGECNIRYVISCTPSYQGYESMREKFQRGLKEILLTGFDVNYRRKLVETLFSRYNKQLDAEQMELLISLDAASSPLWLTMACEELRVFGVFEQVTERIKLLPGTIPELIGMILERIITEDETDKVKPFLCFLRCCNSGLTETEIRSLLREEDTESLPMLIWLKAHRQVKSFLMNTSIKGDQEMLTFFHAAVGEVVASKYLAEEELVKRYHQKLANFFLGNGQNDSRVALSIFKHLKEARLYLQLVEYCQKDIRSVIVSDVEKSFAFKKFRCYTSIFPGKNPFKTAVHICNMCSMRSRLVSQKPLPTNQLCILCGGYAPWKKQDNEAFVCQRHKHNVAPGTDKCYLCKKVIFLTQQNAHAPKMYSKGYLCTHCKLPNNCIKLLI